MKLAAVQMTSGAEVTANLAAAETLVAQAAAAGAGLVVLPENFACMARTDAERRNIAEDDGHGPIQDFLAACARRHRLWLVGGTLPLRAGAKLRSACLLFDDLGTRAARYDKMHLFDAVLPWTAPSGQPAAVQFRSQKNCDVELPNAESYLESAVFEAGDGVVVADTPFGRLGLAVCYDLRFPELFRAMIDRGAELFAVPAAFTGQTGRAHWEILVRARAIENFSWVVAAAQSGRHASGRETYGHSMVADPWGTIAAQLEAGAGVAVANYDRAQLAQIRTHMPSLQHRRLTT